MEKKFNILFRLYKLISNDSDQQINGTLDFFSNNYKDLEDFEAWIKEKNVNINLTNFGETFNEWFRDREEKLKEAAFNRGEN
jgi:phosphoribosyl 1,2-cyclic phosphodiesterase